MKDLKYLQLFDAYGALLTEHQKEVCELYYMCDLSLTEIAEQKGTSKQSVSEMLAKSRALLDEYEEKLHIVQAAQRAAAAAEKSPFASRAAIAAPSSARRAGSPLIRPAFISGSNRRRRALSRSKSSRMPSRRSRSPEDVRSTVFAAGAVSRTEPITPQKP